MHNTDIKFGVFDNFMDQKIHELIENEVGYVQLNPDWHSSIDRSLPNWHWHYSIFQDTAQLPSPTAAELTTLDAKHPYIMMLWKEIKKTVYKFYDHECNFTRAYINAHTYGIDGLAHRDDGDYTAIYYPLTKWNIDHEGGTCLYNETKTDVIHYNAYVPNRLFLFPAQSWHRAMPVTRDCHRLRPVVVFKCVIDVNSASYAKKYYGLR